MILLDTHIWVWWIEVSARLRVTTRNYLDNLPRQDVAISIVSCWEVAKLVEKGRKELTVSLEIWLEQATTQMGITVLPLNNAIIANSAQLPKPFHNDPMDQLIVATARIKDIELLTEDGKILNYPHVKLFKQ